MPGRSWRWLGIAVFGGFFQLATDGWAQDTTGAAPFRDELAVLSAHLDVIEAELSEAGSESDPSLEQCLQSIAQRGDRLSDDAQLRVARLQQQLTALGAPPAPGALPEPSPVATERTLTQGSLAELATKSRVAAFVRVRAQQLLETVAARQRAAVLDVVMMETPPPWNLAVWRDGAAELLDVPGWLRFKLMAWFEWFRVQGGTLALL
jgi:small-conductance mechanosensitive channel